jgi:hypothetical protein
VNNYELMVIIHPDLDEEAANQALEKIKDWIVKSVVRSKKLIIGASVVWLTKSETERRRLFLALRQHACLRDRRIGKEFTNSGTSHAIHDCCEISFLNNSLPVFQGSRRSKNG